MIANQHLRINTQTRYGDIMSESLLPHMVSYNDQQVIWDMEKQIRELQRLIDVNEEINKLELESEINEIRKEHDVLLDIMSHDYVDQLTNPDNPSFGIVTTQDGGTYGIPSIGEFGVHISKHHGDDPYAVGVTQTCEDCGAVFSGNSFTVNEESMDHVAETGHTSFRVNMIGDKTYHESLELPLEPMGALLLTKTREWWDLQDYDNKLEFLSERFRQAGELAKARWIHLPSQVKDSIMNWVDRNSLPVVEEKFKSRKQQQWYHATDQTFYDDEPHENRKVEGESIATEYEYSDEEVSEIGYLDGKNDMKYNARQFMTDKIGDSRKMRIYNSGYHKGKAEQSFESKTSEGIYDPFIDQKSLDQWKRLSHIAFPLLKTSYKKGDYSLDGDDSFGYHGRHLDNLKKDPDGKDDIVYSYKWQKGGETDDIDWTEDKPDETPFYCPMCAMVIEETATYDGVFDHNKQVHGMSDEDSETLAKGFTYSNSPPTSEEAGTDLKWGRDTENDPDFIECPECDGAGYTQGGDIGSVWDQCMGCNGAGVVEITNESKEDNWYDEQIKKVKSQGFPMNRQMREHIKFLERERDNDGKKLNVWEQD